MKNKKPSKKVQREKEVKSFLMARAQELPTTYEDHKCSVPITGDKLLDRIDLLKNWTAEDIEKIDSKKTYYIPGTLTRRVNHYQRMKKLAEKSGPAAAVEYYEQVMGIHKDSIAPKTIGNLKTELDYGSVIRNF
jgi:hypothetical protein